MPKVLRIMNRLNIGGPTYNAAYLTRYLQPEFDTMLLAGMKDDSEERNRWIARLILIVVAAFYGTNFGCVKILNDTLDPSVSALRSGLTQTNPLALYYPTLPNPTHY